MEEVNHQRWSSAGKDETREGTFCSSCPDGGGLEKEARTYKEDKDLASANRSSGSCDRDQQPGAFQDSEAEAAGAST